MCDIPSSPHFCLEKLNDHRHQANHQNDCTNVRKSWPWTDRESADENRKNPWEVLTKFDSFRLKTPLKRLPISTRNTTQNSPKPPHTRAHVHHVTYIHALRMSPLWERYSRSVVILRSDWSRGHVIIFERRNERTRARWQGTRGRLPIEAMRFARICD